MTRPRMNPLCPCRKVGAWRSREDAERRLDHIQANPDPARMYAPINLDQCVHGIWHLTSKSGKRYRKGKLSKKRRPR